MKVRAVKNTHLSIYYNIVIFPVKAVEDEVLLIDHLSGGDYDGDKVNIIFLISLNSKKFLLIK